MSKRIVMLAGASESSGFMYHGLKTEFDILKVVQPGFAAGGRKRLIKRRIKNLGYWTVFGQLLFQVICVRVIGAFSKKRVAELKDILQLSLAPIPEDKLLKVPTVNSDACLQALQELKPDIIIVNGTAIISKKILNGVDATFVNTHVGITPKYRGVHGGYWALANSEKENCGVTVHLVDAGIDTGGILYQGTIEPTKKDNFITYPYLQFAEGVSLMKKALTDICNDAVSPSKRDLESKLWYHPTIWRYLYGWLTKGVK